MEQQADYVTQEEVQEALEMLGKGYDEPAVVIERPRVIAERQPNGEFIERTIPVYVKYSTAFKDELKNITGSELKVWTYIILSINESGVAFPGIRTIADAIGMSHQTVITAIEGLEEKKLLHVLRGEKRYNIYQPSDEYVGIFGKDPMSQKIRTVQKVEQPAKKSQVLRADESNGLDLNKTLNQTDKDNDYATVIKAYEANIGPITPMIAAKLGFEFDEYYNEPDGPNWLLWAFEIASENNALSFAYIKKCLSNRKKYGKNWKPDNGKQQKGNQPHANRTNNPATSKQVDPQQWERDAELGRQILVQRAAQRAGM
jgi:DNA replication protein DnaD